MITRTKQYDLSKDVLDFGFIEFEERESSIHLKDAINTAKESIIFADTENYFFEAGLSEFESLLNQEGILIVGLLNKQTLNNIKNRGVKTGFFRSTDEHINIGIIIVDKKVVYGVLNSKHIYKMTTVSDGEIFSLINHIIWSKTGFEYCQSELRSVTSARLSVIMPNFDKAEHKPESKVKMASVGCGLNADELLLTNFIENNRPSKVVISSVDSYSKDGLRFSFAVFENHFYEFDCSDGSLFKAESFSNTSIDRVVGKNIWFKNTKYIVNEDDEVSYDVKVPLNEVNSYVPNFDEEKVKYKNKTKSLTIKCNVYPIKLDESFTLSNKYKTISKVEAQLIEGIARLEKMDLDKKMLKQIESIKAERLLINKIKMFNDFVSSKEFGVEALNNKKSPVSTINVNESDLIVPNELIGKLYTRNNKNYLATTESRLEEAFKWLKDNKMEATLIEA